MTDRCQKSVCSRSAVVRRSQKLQERRRADWPRIDVLPSECWSQGDDNLGNEWTQAMGFHSIAPAKERERQSVDAGDPVQECAQLKIGGREGRAAGKEEVADGNKASFSFPLPSTPFPSVECVSVLCMWCSGCVGCFLVSSTAASRTDLNGQA